MPLITLVGMPVIPEERLRFSTNRVSFTGKFASKLMIQ
jgi:hypothetical protein